jgi:hypothetical protein
MMFIDEATVAEIAALLGYTGKVQRTSDIRTVLASGHPKIAAWVRAKQVGVQAAACYCRGPGPDFVSPSMAEQEKATLKDVKRIGNARQAVKRMAERGDPKAKRPKVKRARIELPTLNLSQLDIGEERIPGQPVQTCPAHIQRLQDQETVLFLTTAAITSFNGAMKRAVAATPQTFFPTREALKERDPADIFAQALDAMLAYRPVPGKTNGEQNDFAAAARKSIEDAAPQIDQAIAWLTRLRAAVDRKPDDATPAREARNVEAS